MTCHSGSVKEGKFDVSSYENVVKGGKRGAAVVPGKADSSLLYEEGVTRRREWAGRGGGGTVINIPGSGRMTR